MALVRSGGIVKLYINGVASSISVTSDIVNSNLSFWIGKADNSPGGGSFIYYYNGYLSNLRIVKGVAVYTGTFTPSTTQLTSTQLANVNGNPSEAITGTATSLLTCQNSTLIDNSSYVLILTPAGDVRPINSTTPFTQTTTTVALTTLGGTYFDGTGDYLSIPDNAALNIGTSDFEFSCWVYPTVLNSVSTIIGKGTNNLIFGFNSSGTLEISQYGVASRVSASTNLVLNQWSYVVASRVSSISKIFLKNLLKWMLT